MPGSSTPEQFQVAKPRMRICFDPETEIPRLQKWFAENNHPTRQQVCVKNDVIFCCLLGLFLWCIGYIFAIFLPHLKFAEYPLRTDIVNNRWRVCEDIAQKKGVANTFVRKKIDTEGKYIMNTSGSKAHLNDFSCPIYYFYIICCRAVALQSYRSNYKRVFVGLWDWKKSVKIPSRKLEGTTWQIATKNLDLHYKQHI